jgi:mono/diheme cytochrome c family protein
MARVLRHPDFMLTLLGIATVLGTPLVASETGVRDESRPVSQVGAGGSAERPAILLAQKASAKKKRGAGKTAAGAGASIAGVDNAAEDDTEVKFSRDIAPILVGNCIQCHNPERRRGKFDLTTFEKLMAGSDVEKVIVPGKPDQSHLVLRLRGEETPRMPQGNNNSLSAEAIAMIESWVKAGARLDAKIDPKAALKSYALTLDKFRADALRKMPSADIDLMIISAAYERWNQASPDNKPEVTLGTRFLILSTLPKDRAVAGILGMDKAYSLLRTTLSRPSASALDWRVKPSLFVFSDRNSFVAFVRTQENRALGPGETGTANFGVKEPYAAIIDPLGASEVPTGPVPARGKSRTRRAGDELPGNDRSVAGLLAEQLTIGVLKNERDTPRWLYLGLGAYIAAGIDPRSSYVQKLRSSAVGQFQQNWTSRATDALGGRLDSDDTRAIGYALVDWMTHDPQTRRAFPAFVRAMTEEGGSKLDEVLQTVLSARRQDFLNSSGAWVAHYGLGQ